ncbi:unnamed protein product [Acanthoscelides obtectus]|nr:unnamed protein product [Acanthoscelides obtectus]CAK1658701.1 Supporter of activation of yellow protein [Acanthoscelides obtectus]
MLVDEIIDLDPDPPEAPKVAPVEIEVRPVEVKVRSQIARRGGRRGVGGRRPTTERRVVTVPEVEDKSSTETTPLPSPKPPSERTSTPATPQAKSPNPDVPMLEMPLPELTVNVTDIGPAMASTSSANDVILVDEETRMSADTNSRAQTPAKQVVSEVITIDESQSCSVQSTGNNSESSKTPSFRSNKAPRLEVQENESMSGISPDQLTEYYWNGNGPFMLQEQVAQYLGIKSFKRKYPGIMRRPLDIQERDYIREKGLASDHMCDLGLTAVNAADILDIMYADFQDKYEEYCKNLRDKQAKELINKQKAMNLATSHEKSKADVMSQAVQSAAQWNTNFNKTRREQRRACMDLQTLTVHYPKGRMKPILNPTVGNYPVSLVPGQFVDYFKEFTPTEINNLPLNTMLYDELHRIPPDDSEDSGSESDSSSGSDSSSSGSDSDSSSGVEDCKLCKHTALKKSPNPHATASATPVIVSTAVPVTVATVIPVTK